MFSHKNLTRYALPFHLIAIGVLAFLSGSQSMVQGFSPISFYWLIFFAVEMTFCLPSLRKHETFADARWRVWTSSVWDPLLYVGLFLFLFLLISGFNSGCKLEYQLDTGYWEMGEPPVSWLPFSVRSAPAFFSAAVACSVFVGAVLVRQALTRTTKRSTLQALAIASGVVALFRSIPFFELTDPQVLFLQTGSANAYGIAFGFWAICSLGLFNKPDEGRSPVLWTYALFFFGVFSNLLGMLFFANSFSTGIGILLFLIMFGVQLFLLRGRIPYSAILKTIVLSVFLVGGGFALMRYAYPNNPVAVKLSSFEQWEEKSKVWGQQLSARTGAAMEMFRDHLWCGVGVDGYGQFVGLTLEKDSEWKPFRKDQGIVGNDYVQLLAEYGLVGCGILLSTIVILLAPIFYRTHLYFSLISDKNAKGYYPFPLEVASGLAATIFAALSAGLGNPFRSPAVVLSMVFVLSVLPVFLPKKQTVTEYEG